MSAVAMFSRLSPRMLQLVPALLAVTAAAALFVYNVFVVPDRETAAQVLALADRIRADDAVLSARLRAPSPPAPLLTTAGPPQHDLLWQMSDIAAQAGVRLVRMTPLPDKRDQLEIELQASFADVVKFVGQLEARCGVVRRLQLQARPGETIVAVSFVLDWKPSDHPAVPPAAVLSLVARAVSSDPFRPLRDRSDASLRGHVLTGITTSGGEVFATIDSRDYRLGDPVGDGKITAIGDDAVQLSSDTGQTWLHFRKRPQ